MKKFALALAGLVAVSGAALADDYRFGDAAPQIQTIERTAAKAPASSSVVVASSNDRFGDAPTANTAKAPSRLVYESAASIGGSPVGSDFGKSPHADYDYLR